MNLGSALYRRYVVPAYLVVVKDDTLVVEEFEKIGVVEDVGGLA